MKASCNLDPRGGCQKGENKQLLSPSLGFAMSYCCLLKCCSSAAPAHTQGDSWFMEMQVGISSPSRDVNMTSVLFAFVLPCFLSLLLFLGYHMCFVAEKVTQMHISSHISLNDN